MATLLEMENKVRRNLGDNTSGTQRYNQTLIRDLINEGYLYYAAIMIDSGEGDFAMAPETIDIVANRREYDLSTVLSYIPVRVRLIERSYSSTWYVLNKWEKNSGTINSNGVGSGHFFPSYRFIGTNLSFNLIPSFSESDTVRIEGYKQPDELSGDSDEPASGFLNLYHNILVLYSSIGALESKEATGMVGDTEAFRGRLSKLEAQFISTINNRTSSRESVDPYLIDEQENWS